MSRWTTPIGRSVPALMSWPTMVTMVWWPRSSSSATRAASSMPAAAKGAMPQLCVCTCSLETGARFAMPGFAVRSAMGWAGGAS